MFLGFKKVSGQQLTVFKKLRTNCLIVWWWEVKAFINFLVKYSTKRIIEVLERLETGKGVVVDGLVAKRGKYTRPFLHTGMMALFLVGLMLAPVLKGAVEKESSYYGAGGAVLGSSGMETMETTTMVSVKPRDGVVTYIVQQGDTVSGIANKFGISIDTIRWQNDLESIESIKPGEKLEIPPVTGIVYKVKRGETVYSIAKKFDVAAQNIVNWPFNSYANDETFDLAVGQILMVPDGVKPAEKLWDPKRYVAQKTPDAGSVSAVGQFIWPSAGVITQRFVWYHQAIDIANKAMPPVLAADAGRVTEAGWPDSYGYGNRVRIDHGNGYETMYAHLSSIAQ